LIVGLCLVLVASVGLVVAAALLGDHSSSAGAPPHQKQWAAPLPASVQPPNPCPMLSGSDLRRLGLGAAGRGSHLLASAYDPNGSCGWLLPRSGVLELNIETQAADRAADRVTGVDLRRAGWHLRQQGPEIRHVDGTSISYAALRGTLSVFGPAGDAYLELVVPVHWVGPVDAPVAVFKAARQRLLAQEQAPTR
jgi:hypothetical protein